MDTRTGALYPDLSAALDAGVPRRHVEPVDVVTIQNGPFKGRHYVRLSDGRLGRRVSDAELRSLNESVRAEPAHA